MKKKILMLSALLITVGAVMTGCQGAARSFGGSITLRLDPGVKLDQCVKMRFLKLILSSRVLNGEFLREQ